MSNHEDFWHFLEGDQAFANHPSASWDFPSEEPLSEGHESGFTEPWTSTTLFPYDVQNTLTAGSTYVEPHQLSIDNRFGVTEPGGRAEPQNASSSYEPSETVPWDDMAMLDHASMPATTSDYQLQQQGPVTGIATPVVDFHFVSGSPPLERSEPVKALPEIVQEPNETPKESGLKCNIPGCRSKTTFKRNYELQRHMKKHTREVTFDCPAVNCKYRGLKAFYRSDKLTAHVIAAHDEETLFACPIAGCFSARTPLSRAILAVHMRNHDCGSTGQYPGYVSALGGTDTKRTCPVGNCAKKLRWNCLQEHLLQHTEAERTALGTDVAAAGFDPLNVYVICPIPSCLSRFPDLPAFHDHLIDHISVDPDHLRTWTNQVSSVVDGEIYPWQQWRLTRGNWGYNLICSNCGKVDSKGLRLSHQLYLLKDLKELHPYREQILRLCPGFGYNPIFDDVMPVVHRRTQRLP